MEEIAFRQKSPIAGTYQTIWPKLKLTAQQQALWDETRAAALWALPFVTDVWYAMMVDDDGQTAWFTDQVPIAATDDTFMYINPETFFKLTLEERVFVCAHEVFHCVFNHMGINWGLQQAGQIPYPDGIILQYDHELMDIAADCVINALLVKSNVGGMPKGCWLLKAIPAEMSVLEAYRKLYKKRPGGGGGGDEECEGDEGGSGGNKDGDKEGKGRSKVELPQGGKSFDKHLRPGEGRGKDPNTAEVERNPQQWINAVNAAMESARMAGNLPAAMERAFTKVLTVDVDWLELYPTAVSKALGRDQLSWMYLDPEYLVRGVGFPGKIRHGCGTIVVIFDTSGSINQKELDLFAGVTQGVIDAVKPRLLIVGECDADLYRWDEIEDIADLKGKVTGGGGTSFIPPFERVKKEGLEPELLIYLTDLEGSAPTSPPPYPVIWACITDNKGPWGTTIKVPKQAA